MGTVRAAIPGYGSDQVHLSLLNQATNTGNTNITLPASGAFASPIYAGTIRVATATVGVNATCKVAAIIGIDASNASNQIQIFGGDGSASPVGVGIDETFVIRSGVTFGSINVVVNVATNNCTHDVHLSANPPRAVSF